MADQRDVIEVLEQDHREVEQMFAELESLRGAATDEAKARRKDLTEQVTIELVRHSVAEEVLVYPKVEDKVSADEVEHAREVADSLVFMDSGVIVEAGEPTAVLTQPRHERTREFLRRLL